MNWEDKAEQLLAYLEEGIRTAGDFTVEQAPILVQEFFMWFTAHHIFFIVLGVTLVILGYWLHGFGLDEEDHKRGLDWYHDSDGFYMVLPICSAVAGILMFFHNVYDLIQILVAPRIYLIETLSTWLGS